MRRAVKQYRVDAMAVLKNPKHERFAQELAKGATADEAYQSAGYKPHRGNASTLRANQSILDRVSELQQKAAERAIVTIDDIARQLDDDRSFARQNGASSAAVAATMGKAKVLGLIVDKHDVSGSINLTVAHEDAEL